MRTAKDISEVISSNSDLLNLDSKKARVIYEAQVVYTIREKAIESGSIIKVIMLIRYLKYYPRVKAWVGDLLSAL